MGDLLMPAPMTPTPLANGSLSVGNTPGSGSFFGGLSPPAAIAGSSKVSPQQPLQSVDPFQVGNMFGSPPRQAEQQPMGGGNNPFAALGSNGGGQTLQAQSFSQAPSLI
eukprot:6628392-Pyramimonas_sp.AAC.1